MPELVREVFPGNMYVYVNDNPQHTASVYATMHDVQNGGLGNLDLLQWQVVAYQAKVVNGGRVFVHIGEGGPNITRSTDAPEGFIKGEISWTLSAADIGEYYAIIVRAVNSANEAENDWDIYSLSVSDIEASNQPPSISLEVVDQATVGELYEFYIAAQ